MSDFVNKFNKALDILANLGRKRNKNEKLSYTEFKPLDEDWIIGDKPKNIKKRDENNKDNFRKFVRRKYRC